MLGKEVTSKVLDDYKTAPIPEKLRAMLGVLETATRTPEALAADDFRKLLDAGISAQAILDALYVMYCFNIYPRLSDALGWYVPSEAGFARGAQMLLKRGYGKSPPPANP